MEYSTSKFKFSVPDSFNAFTENNRLVFQSESGIELILSVKTISRNGESGNTDEIKAKLIEMSLSAITNAASDPQLKISTPLRREVIKNGVQKWELSCEVINDDYIFEQAVLVSDSAVLLVTFESPKTNEAVKFYKEFILSIDTNIQEL